MFTRREILQLGAIASLTPKSLFAQESNYDISYCWTSDVAYIVGYKAEITQVLGPVASRQLRIVQSKSSGNYGLIRDFNSQDAQMTRAQAERDAAILKKAGLFHRAELINDRTYEEVHNLSNSSLRRIPREAFQDLERVIQDQINALHRKGQVASNETIACSVQDLATNDQLVSINARVPLQSASMIKSYLAMFYLGEFGTKKYSQTIKDTGKYSFLGRDFTQQGRLEAMIQGSDNGSANWVMDQLGGVGKVQQLLQKYSSLLPDTQIVEYIPLGENEGQTYGNKSSAADYTHFLKALWDGKLPESEELKRLHSLTKRQRLGADLPRGALIYNKTGSTIQQCGDMALIVASDSKPKHHPYSIVVVVDRNLNESQREQERKKHYDWARGRAGVIKQLSNLVYDHMQYRHDLIPRGSVY